MSTDGSRLVFTPEHPGAAVHWTFGPTDTETLRFPVGAWNVFDVSADARVVVLPREGDLVVWRLDRTATQEVISRKVGNAQFALSRDGKWLAYVKGAASIELAGLEGQPTRTAQGLAQTVVQMQIDPGSDVLLAALDDGRLLRWRIRDGQSLPTLRARRPVLSISFDWTGDEMALGLEGGGVELWKKPWIAPIELMRSSSGVMNVSFAPDDPWLAVATRDGTVSAWGFSGVSLGEPVRFDGLARAWAQERGSLLGVSLGGTSARWMVPLRHAPRQYDLSGIVGNAWFISEDGFFAIGEHSVLEQRGDRGESRPRYRSALYVSPDRSHSATAYTNGFYLREGMPSQLNSDRADKLLVRAMVDSAMFSADGKRLVAAGGGKGYLFDVATGVALGTPIDGVSQAWLNQDGTILATKGNDVGLTLWQCASDGSLTRLPDVDTRVVSSVAFSRDSRTLVLATENEARVWSLRDRRFVGRTVAHDAAILNVGFSPDGRWIVTTSTDKRARIWEAASGLPASDWFEHDGSVTAASFSPSGRKLLTASTDGLVRVWDLAGTGDATGQDRRWLARLAEILSGMRIDPETNEAVPAPAAFATLESLRGEIQHACPGTLIDPPGCASATTGLIRSVIGTSGDRPPFGPVQTAAAR
ncbi:MAG TPA: WD40 repeat domain-containing protein, partial [Kofleriaceae bacterium]